MRSVSTGIYIKACEFSEAQCVSLNLLGKFLDLNSMFSLVDTDEDDDVIQGSVTKSAALDISCILTNMQYSMKPHSSRELEDLSMAWKVCGDGLVQQSSLQNLAQATIDLLGKIPSQNYLIDEAKAEILQQI